MIHKKHNLECNYFTYFQVYHMTEYGLHDQDLIPNGIFLFPITSKMLVEITQPSTQKAERCFSWKEKWLQNEANH